METVRDIDDFNRLILDFAKDINARNDDKIWK